MKYSITLLRYHLFVLLPSFSQRNNIYSSHRELDSSHGREPGPEARSAMLRLFLWVRIQMIASLWRAITDTIGFATDSVGVSVLLLPKLTKEVSFHRDCARLRFGKISILSPEPPYSSFFPTPRRRTHTRLL